MIQKEENYWLHALTQLLGVKIQLVGVQLVTPMQEKDKEVIAVLVKPVGKMKDPSYTQIAQIGDFAIKIVVAEEEMKTWFRQEHNQKYSSFICFSKSRSYLQQVPGL